MSTKREQIIEAITTTLANTAGVGGRVWRSRVEAFTRNEAPSLVIMPGQDRTDQVVSLPRIDWTLQVLIMVTTRGSVPDQLADPIVSDIHARLMADRTLGGLCKNIWPISVDPQFDKADATSCWTVCTWQVEYRTSTTNISS